MADLGASPFTISTTANYTIPPWVTSLQVECYGGGATGRDAYPSGYGGSGGGGGAYSKRNAMPVTPGNSYTFTVGATAVFANPGVNGNQSTVTGDLGVVCTAVGGAYQTTVPWPYALGGAAGSCVGDVKYSGGNGGGGGNGNGGGGGGEGAWSGGDGNVGSDYSGPINGGAGGTGTAGGDGGRGGNKLTNAGVAPGVTPGGGGGGSGTVVSFSPAGNGASGRIIVTYTANTNISFVLEGN